MPTAGTIMNRAASLLNDTPRTLYTYAAQIPYINMALHELMEELERHDIATTTHKSSIVTNIAAGVTTIALPADLIEIKSLEERNFGGNATDFRGMVKMDTLPDITPTSEFIYWAWDAGAIKFNASTGIRDIRINYIARIQADVADENSVINIPNSDSFLWYRTAGLCAEFIGENKPRADSLNQLAVMSIERAMGIKVKANQVQAVRRRPFMFGRKMVG